MANFRTHISVAATASCFLSIALLKGGLASEKEVVLYFTLGTIGGILPDIDSDHSLPSRFLFGFFALALTADVQAGCRSAVCGAREAAVAVLHALQAVCLG